MREHSNDGSPPALTHLPLLASESAAAAAAASSSQQQLQGVCTIMAICRSRRRFWLLLFASMIACSQFVASSIQLKRMFNKKEKPASTGNTTTNNSVLLHDTGTKEASNTTTPGSSITTVHNTPKNGDGKLLLLNEASSKSEAYLSACLLYMDDNHRLPEWLAYHYYNLNLRHVIINVDFRSLNQPPTEILDRWHPFVSSEVWHPKDWMDPGRYNDALEKTQNNITIPNSWQVQTQNMFNRRCAQHHQSLNRTWVSFSDTDEFWLLNPDKVHDSIIRMSQPGSVLNYIADAQADNTASTTTATGTNETHWLPMRYRGPCLTTHRLLFIPKESTELEIRRQVPDWIDPKRFETLRWRYHVPENTRQNGKAMLDVSRINASVLADPVEFNAPHRVINFCHQTWLDEDSHLRLHHYLGSWEYFNYRQGDSRWAGNRERYEGKTKNMKDYASHASDDIRPWLIGFIRHMGGEEIARELLKDQGILQNQNSVPLGLLFALPPVGA